MQIHLSDILSKEGKVVEQQVDFEKDEMSFLGDTYKILEKTPVNLRITNQGNQELLLEAGIKLKLAIPCGRCLKDVETQFCLDFSREVDMKVSDEERQEQMDEDNYIAGYELDVDALIADEIVLQWPMKVL